MSIKITTDVWGKSSHSGSELVMLLAIADHANENGYAYPGVESLAFKCRMKMRNANYILKALQDSGELIVYPNKGRKGTNLYRITLAHLKERKPLQSVAPLQELAPLQGSAATPATQCAATLQPIADEPSLNHQEPSTAKESHNTPDINTPDPKSSLSSAVPITPSNQEKPLATKPPKAAPASIPDCPHESLIDLYAERLPELPQPIKSLWLGGKNAPQMKSRWAWVLTACHEHGEKKGQRYAETHQEAVAWFDKLFKYVSRSDFLTGRSSKWSCDLGWLMNKGNFEKVISGNYDNKVEAA